MHFRINEINNFDINNDDKKLLLKTFIYNPACLLFNFCYVFFSLSQNLLIGTPLPYGVRGKPFIRKVH